MKYKEKKHPRRKAMIQDITLVGHRGVRLHIWYSTRSKDCETGHEQEFDLTLCDARFLGYQLQRIADDLQKKLDEFRRAISS